MLKTNSLEFEDKIKIFSQYIECETFHYFHSGSTGMPLDDFCRLKLPAIILNKLHNQQSLKALNELKFKELKWTNLSHTAIAVLFIVICITTIVFAANLLNTSDHRSFGSGFQIPLMVILGFAAAATTIYVGYLSCFAYPENQHRLEQQRNGIENRLELFTFYKEICDNQLLESTKALCTEELHSRLTTALVNSSTLMEPIIPLNLRCFIGDLKLILMNLLKDEIIKKNFFLDCLSECIAGLPLEVLALIKNLSHIVHLNVLRLKADFP